MGLTFGTDGRRLGSSGSTSSGCAKSAGAHQGGAEKSELGALLCFDMNNIRYITATHIGTWAMDKLVRFSCCPAGRRADPVGLRLGGPPSSDLLPLARRALARRHLHLRGATHRGSGLAEDVARKIKLELEKRGLHNEPVGVDVIEMPVLFALQAKA
jgi:hypothetical protein